MEKLQIFTKKEILLKWKEVHKNVQNSERDKSCHRWICIFHLGWLPLTSCLSIASVRHNNGWNLKERKNEEGRIRRMKLGEGGRESRWLLSKKLQPRFFQHERIWGLRQNPTRSYNNSMKCRFWCISFWKADGIDGKASSALQNFSDVWIVLPWQGGPQARG